MDIWHIDNIIATSIILWRTKKNQFRLTQAGDFKALLSNPNYILINKKYSSLFRSLDEQVTFESAEVYNSSSTLISTDYVELYIKNEIDKSSIKNENSIGDKIWTMNGYVFVSGDLKNKLKQRGEDDFAFTLGFSMFGG
jgi:hypothetical protein